MKIQIQANNVELSDALKSYINEKIGELEKFIQDPNGEMNAWVTVGKPSRHHENGNVFQAVVDLHLPGRSVRAEAVGADLMVAIVEVKDELQREIKKYKGKVRTQRLKGFRLFKSWKNKD